MAKKWEVAPQRFYSDFLVPDQAVKNQLFFFEKSILCGEKTR